MHWLTWFALRQLWARRGRSLLSLSALALAVGLVVATGGIGAGMQAALATPSPLLSSIADGSTELAEILWISSAYDVDYDLPAELAVRVEAVPGVAAVQPMLRRPVRVQTPAGDGGGPRSDDLILLGVDPVSYFGFHGLSLAAGNFPTAGQPGLVALAPWALVRGLGLGQSVTLTTPSGDVDLPIAGLLEVESLASVQQGLVLYAPLEIVAETFGLSETITALEVRLAPDALARRARAALEDALGPAYAVSAASRSGRSVQLWQHLVLGALIAVDALALAGGAMLVYAVFASAARARYRQIGLLRAAGAQRRQVLGLLMLEAILLGLAGSALGLAFGFLFARAGAALVLESAGGPGAVSIPGHLLLLGVVLGLLASLAGAIGPAWRAARMPPLAAWSALPALAPAAAQPRPGSGLLPGASSHLAQSFPEVRLAAANLVRERRRAALIVTTLALVLAVALGNVGVLSLVEHELAAALGRLVGGDYLVLPRLSTLSLRELAGQDTSDVPPLSAGLLAAMEELGDQVWLMRGTTASIEDLQVFPGQPTLLVDVDGYARMGGFRFEEGNWPQALETFRQGPAVLLAPVVARRLGAHLGDSVRLDTLRGPLEFLVAGIGQAEFATCVLDLAGSAGPFGANEVNGVMVQVRPGAGAGAVRQALLDAVRAHGGTLLPLSQASAQLAGILHQTRRSIGLLIGIVGLVAMLGVVNAVLSSLAERRREFGLLRTVGATRRQVARLILIEMAILGSMAALVGTGLGWGITLLFLGIARACLGLPGEAAASLSVWIPLTASSLMGLVLWPLLALLGGLGPALSTTRLQTLPG
jgi:putative ABC transport system permease protein